MNTHYLYRYADRNKKSNREISYVVLFFSINGDQISDLDESIKDYFRSNSPVDYAILLYPDYLNETIQTLTANSSAIKRLMTLLYQKQLILLSYDHKGKIEYLEGPIATEEIVRKEVINRIRRNDFDKLKEAALFDIFIRRGGLLESDDNFHYILPSGSHSKQFIRVGNILGNGAEVHFIALCLLPFMNDDTKYIYCDSASIAAVVYSAILMKSKIGEKSDLKFDAPAVESFGGYSGIKEYFFNRDNCLVIISSSTSGKLKKIVQEKDVDAKSIVTLYYNGVSENDRNILINIADFANGHRQRFLFEKYQSEKDCAYCNKNSIPVQLSGDQFLPGKPTVNQVMIKVTHKPDWLEKFMKEYYGRKIIKCHFGPDEKKVREFFLDLDVVHLEIENDIEKSGFNTQSRSNKSYRNSFYRFLENQLPVTVSTIIYLPDSASEKMAKQVNAYFESNGIQAKRLLTMTEFLASKHVDLALIGTVLIVSSSIATGKKLYQLSLRFRDYSELSIFYFFGICRTPTDRVFTTLKNDLIFRRDVRCINRFDFIESIYIPDRHTHFGKDLENSPWDYEKKFLRKNLPINCLNKTQIRAKNTRIQNIESAETNNGMFDGLFWPSRLGSQQLELRKSFAFFDFDYHLIGSKRQVSQADVYFTISAILHSLRTGLSGTNVLLYQHEHQRSVIAPETFTRYSDGLIQACYLRAAQPGELNYSIDFNLSYDMKRVLVNIFDDRESQNSEALYEFLYALAIEKLKLLESDTRDFVEFVQRRYGRDSVTSMLLGLVRKTFI